MSVHSVSLQEAEHRLKELVARLDQGDEVEIVRGAQPTIKLVVDAPGKKRQFGQHQGQGWIAEDFDAPLEPAIWLGKDA